ncbi:sensor histidine kinase [Chitinimonas sp.]|uniref:sensor histidine kinase n=1 Tax=Chitinimonas sp. TaxID=1934313 RepID=UPI0035B2EE45
MHPMLASLRGLISYSALASLVGALLACLLWLTGAGSLPAATLFALPFSLCFGLVVLSAYHVCRSLPFAGHAAFNAVAVRGGACLVAAVLGLLLGLGWNEASQAMMHSGPALELAPSWRVALALASGTAYLLSILAHEMHAAALAAREATDRAQQARLLARDTELQLLRTQIDPHFLFNSLNAISALTRLDLPAAQAMIVDLAEFFRHTSLVATQAAIPLADELALCTHYLRIEQHRFGPKLQVDMQIADAARPAMVPPLCLQPLLENALKHGIRQLDDGGTLQLEALLRDGWLHLAVRNPVDATATSALPGNGQGLRNLRERLASLYGNRARLAWQQHDGHFTVELALPFEEATRS